MPKGSMYKITSGLAGRPYGGMGGRFYDEIERLNELAAKSEVELTSLKKQGLITKEDY